MTFEELVDQALAMLERRGRVTYRALKRQFQLADDALEDLTAEIIKAQRLAVDEDGIQYTFKHALTQQVAYETLLQERRRALHARIVEALGSLAGDRIAEQGERLAHHALRGEVWNKALVHGRQAWRRPWCSRPTARL